MATDFHGLKNSSRATLLPMPNSTAQPPCRPEIGLKHAELTQAILSVFYSVYNDLGYGFLESVYDECMAIAMREAGLRVERQVPLPVWFRGHKLGDFRADLLVSGVVLLELKSARLLDEAHEAQLLHYLRSTDIEIGLLLNFGIRPQFKRLLFDNERKKIRINPRESAAGVSA
jgi:GxxExxY protein